MIVPGSVNPLLMVQGGDPLDEFGRIERSLRCRGPAAPYLTFTPTVAGNRTVWTWFGWLKPSQITEMVLFYVGTTSQNLSQISLATGGGIRVANKISDAYTHDFTTSRLHRDPSVHLPVMISCNGSNWLKIYAGGTAIAVPAPAANNWFFNTAAAHYISRRTVLSNSPIDGNLSYLGWVDGQALTQDAVFRQHPRTGQWRPKSKTAIRAAVAAGGGVRNGWGVNGFFLSFDDPTSLTSLGYDRSQGDDDTTGNNWTAVNFSLADGVTYDSSLDTPTNNFPTFNPLTGFYAALGNAALNFGTNLTATGQVVATQPIPSSGRWYYEILFGNYAGGSGPRCQLGIATAKSTNTNGYDTESFGFDSGTGHKYYASAGSAYCGAIAANTIVGFIADADAGTLSLTLNGVDQGVAFSGIDFSRGFFPAASDAWASAYGCDVYINFGQRPFSYPAAGTKAICTKNLPIKPAGPMKSSDAFIALTDTGPNIVAALASAAPWVNAIRIYKRRDAAEGWRWQFSDDPGFYLDCSSAAAKAAFPALAGLSYIGYALRTEALFGVTTGRLVHVNGVPDVVADGLSKSRKMVILKNEAGGSWYVHHPELTAGKLVYLEQVAAETTDATIGAVNSSGFTVAAALASGTYRWIALAETAGFISLRSYTGNGSTDGPFYPAQQAALVIEKGVTGSTANWNVHDTLRDPGNVADAALYLNLAQGEDPANTNVQIDINAAGVKVRHNVSPYNVSGNKFISLAVGGFPFRYANAR